MGKPMMTLPPLLSTISSVHEVVPTAWRREATCTVDGEGLIWGGDEMAFHAIATVAYATRERSLNLVQRRVERRIHVTGGGRSLSIELATAPFGPRHENHHRALYCGIVDALNSTVEPRLCGELIREVAAGSVVSVGSLDLAAEGMRHRQDLRGSALGWDQLPVASFDGEHVTVRAAGPRPGNLGWVVDMIEPNAVLLPELLAECAKVFS